ncbi:MAG: hypothetical protein DRJ03_24590, partial [Chloroflexi bacterium]
MFSRKWYILASVVTLLALTLTACGGGEVQTVVITAPPEEVEVEVPVEVTVPPEIIEVTAEPGLGAGCTYNAYRMG